MYYIFMPRPRGYIPGIVPRLSLLIPSLPLSRRLSSERSPLFLTPCRPFCFVDDFTRVGHVRKISQTMVGFSSKEDSIAISSLDRVERNLHTSVAIHSFISKDLFQPGRRSCDRRLPASMMIRCLPLLSFVFERNAIFQGTGWWILLFRTCTLRSTLRDPNFRTRLLLSSFNT